MAQTLRCVDCNASYDLEMESAVCEQCGDTLEVTFERRFSPASDPREQFRWRLASYVPHERSGVWRFRELLPEFDAAQIVSLGEGNAPEFSARGTSAWSGLENLWIKHLGYNPTGSYKDAGMSVAVTRARAASARMVACASTGNTSASLATYAARAGMQAVVILPAAHVTDSKLAQAIDAGALTLTIQGDFDAAMRAVRELAHRGLVYLVNSLNPFRREGQKTVAFEILESRGWRAPDWIVLPGGNLGHCVSLAKGFSEAFEVGFADRMPRIALVQADGAAPFVRAWETHLPLEPVKAETFATAIRIGNPVSWRAALRALDATQGIAVAVSDAKIAEARAVLARDGLGCEPASAAALAGAAELRARNVIASGAEIVVVLTGDSLKDTAAITRYHNDGSARFANPVRPVKGDIASLERAIDGVVA